MGQGGPIVCDASINPSFGHPELVEYRATKGAIAGLARSLNSQLVSETGIRVNVRAGSDLYSIDVSPANFLTIGTI